MPQVAEGQWRLRVFAGRQAGKTVHVSRNFHGTKRQAQTALSKLLADVERGQVARGHTGTLADLLDRWAEDIAPTRSAYTMREHRRTIENDIKPALGPVRLDKLTARHLDGFYRQFHERGLSPASVRRHHAVLSAALGRAVRWGLIPSNPALRANPPGPQGATVSAPAVTDVQRIIAEAERSDPVLAAALGATTGACRGELCALRWSDVDRAKRTLTIARSLTVIERQPQAGKTKTHQRRDIAIGEGLGALLARRRKDQERYAQTVGVDLAGDPFILSRSADGATPCLPDGLTAGYRRVTKRLGSTSHMHELRHFAPTTAIAGGADVRTVAGRLGHADASVTLRVYAHALEAQDREVAGLLDGVLLGSSQPALPAAADQG